jgi:hypothetical protein
MENQKPHQLSKKGIEALASRLPSDYIDMVKKRTSRAYSSSYISQVKTGKKRHHEILRVLLEIAEEEDNRKQKLEKVAEGKVKLEEADL